MPIDSKLIILLGFLGLLVLIFFWGLISKRLKGKYTRNGETIEFHQKGPVIHGRSNQHQGYYYYSGWRFGPWLLLSRKEYGLGLLVSQGFPETIAQQVEGSTVGSMFLRIKDSHSILEGHYRPQRIAFDKHKGTITHRSWQESQHRLFRKV